MSGNVEVENKVVSPAVAARLASLKARKDAGLVGRTAMVPVWLNRADHVRAHEGCHAAAGLWNQAVAWLRGQWDAGETPSKEDVRRYVTSLPVEARPFHAHTAQAIAYDWPENHGTVGHAGTCTVPSMIDGSSGQAGAGVRVTVLPRRSSSRTSSRVRRSGSVRRSYQSGPRSV